MYRVRDEEVVEKCTRRRDDEKTRSKGMENTLRECKSIPCGCKASK